MQIGGTLITAVVRIAVFAATLALIYYFVIRPVLDTTETVSSGINDNIQRSLDQANEAFEMGDMDFGPQRQENLTDDIKRVPTNKLPRLNRCISNAGANLDRIERCAERLGR